MSLRGRNNLGRDAEHHLFRALGAEIVSRLDHVCNVMHQYRIRVGGGSPWTERVPASGDPQGDAAHMNVMAGVCAARCGAGASLTQMTAPQS